MQSNTRTKSKNIRLRDLNSFDISTDSEDILDEIIITPSTFEQHAFNFLHPSTSSPIHFCDNNIHSDDNIASMPSTSTNIVAMHNTTITTTQNEEIEESTIATAATAITMATPSTTTTFSNQLTADSCNMLKNSKSRRMEYSMRGMKMCSSSSGSCNPSQDSAFGSMTDGELSIASSTLRSFQSISSPIDEGVEDSIGLPGPSLTSSLSQTSNNESTDLNDCNIPQSSSTCEFGLSNKKKSASFGTSMEPPTILVNDKNSFYTTSPAKAFGTIEVFSQKYRVSSFEDMTSKRAFLKNVQKQNFRSLEEEKRIDSAFMPIGKSQQLHHRSFDANRSSAVNNSEKFKKLTHVAFASKISTTRERHTIWKNSILARKNNLIKSNESLHDYSSHAYSYGGYSVQQHGYYREQKLHKRVNSTNELCSSHRYDAENRQSPAMGESFKYPKKSCSERYLLNLMKLKQTTISSDCDECDEDDSISIHRSEIESFIDETSSTSSSSGCHQSITGTTGSNSTLTNTVKTENNSTDSSPSHRSMCKIIGGIETDTRQTEEKLPLLDGMEMSAISPTETDEML